jgi:thiol:disulfide interchange protein
MISRRLLLTASLLAAPLLLAPRPAAAAGQFQDYKPGMVDAALKAGKTVFIDYAAEWCGTCKAQERVLDTLLRENPAYAAKMTFVRVDWDKYGTDAIAVMYNIPRRSTLLLLKGDKELGRIVAGTDTAAIKTLLDRGL